MNATGTNDIFLVCTPGLEDPAAAEARAAGFDGVRIVPGGVQLTGTLSDLWRANLDLRGPTRVLIRIAEFRALHPAQLDKRARKIDWASWLRADVPVRVEAVSRKSRIYHAGAAQSRVERAITETLGAPVAKDAPVVVKVRIDDDLCTISLDSSGESLHKRGHKQAVNKAPMRETMAAMFLRAAGYQGDEPVYDPMCGSGTFPIEAAEIAAGLLPGRSRHFAFEAFANFDTERFAAMRTTSPGADINLRFYGSDRDAGAIEMSRANAERAGVGALCQFEARPVGGITPPCPQRGLVIVNPPYGGRIGNKGPLYGLYASLGEQLKTEFKGWRVALITTEAGLAGATGLPFKPPGPFVAHGGLKVRLWMTGPLG